MSNLLVNYFKIENLRNFYKAIKYTGFQTITEERKSELDAMVNKYRYYYYNNAVGQRNLVALTIEKIHTSSRLLNLNNGDEKLYFYINMIDPELKFLQIYESTNTLLERQELCTELFHYYDPVIMKIEKKYNEYFKIYQEEDLWDRNAYLINMASPKEKKR